VFKVIVSPRAWQDFFEIFDYIHQDNPEAAAGFCNTLLDHVELLATFPRLGTILSKRPGVRKVLHSPVRIYYQINEARESVEILHFWHAARREPEDL
jgi:plasmid stabilization system protein ParE